jgi:peptide/nickel transport system permease protein
MPPADLDALSGPALAFESADPGSEGAGWVRRLGSELRRSPAAMVGAALVGLHLLLALAGPALAPYSPTEFHPEDTLQGPSARYWLGTDQFGRDLLSRVVVGARSLLLLAYASTGLGVAAGLALGLVSGYFGGRLDEILMRVADGLMSFPSLFLALLIRATLGPSPVNIVLGIAVVFAPRVARVIRSVVLELRTREFVQAAHVRGEGAVYIMLRELLPNAVGPIVVEASIRLSYAILIGASLGFIGVGVPPPTPDWGRMVFEGRSHLASAPWLTLAPAAAISSLVVGTTLLADAASRVLEGSRHVEAGR